MVKLSFKLLTIHMILKVSRIVFFLASLNGDMVDLNMVQVSVVRSSSAQRPIVDSVNVRNSLDGDSQHRRTSSFPENMTAGKRTTVEI